MASTIDAAQLDDFVQDLMRAIAKPLDRPPDPKNVILVLTGLAFVTGAVLGGTDATMAALYQRVLRTFLEEHSSDALYH